MASDVESESSRSSMSEDIPLAAITKIQPRAPRISIGRFSGVSQEVITESLRLEVELDPLAGDWTTHDGAGYITCVKCKRDIKLAQGLAHWRQHCKGVHFRAAAEQQRIVIEARDAAQKADSKSTEAESDPGETTQQQPQPEEEDDQLTEDENDTDNAPEAPDYSIPKWYPVLEVKIAALRFEIQKDPLAEPLADLKVTCRTCRKPMPMDHTWRTHCAVVHGRSKEEQYGIVMESRQAAQATVRGVSSARRKQSRGSDGQSSSNWTARVLPPEMVAELELDPLAGDFENDAVNCKQCFRRIGLGVGKLTLWRRHCLMTHDRRPSDQDGLIRAAAAKVTKEQHAEEEGEAPASGAEDDAADDEEEENFEYVKLPSGMSKEMLLEARMQEFELDPLVSTITDTHVECSKCDKFFSFSTWRHHCSDAHRRLKEEEYYLVMRARLAVTRQAGGTAEELAEEEIKLDPLADSLLDTLVHCIPCDMHIRQMKSGSLTAWRKHCTSRKIHQRTQDEQDALVATAKANVTASNAARFEEEAEDLATKHKDAIERGAAQAIQDEAPEDAKDEEEPTARRYGIRAPTGPTKPAANFTWEGTFVGASTEMSNEARRLELTLDSMVGTVNDRTVECLLCSEQVPTRHWRKHCSGSHSRSREEEFKLVMAGRSAAMKTILGRSAELTLEELRLDPLAESSLVQGGAVYCRPCDKAVKCSFNSISTWRKHCMSSLHGRTQEERDGLIAQAKANVEAAAATAADAKSEQEQAMQTAGPSTSHTELATEPSTSTLYTTPSLASSRSTPSIQLAEMQVDLPPPPPKVSGVKRPAEDDEYDLPPTKRQRVDSPVPKESAATMT